jgi:hypothetical protein
MLIRFFFQFDVGHCLAKNQAKDGSYVVCYLECRAALSTLELRQEYSSCVCNEHRDDERCLSLKEALYSARNLSIRSALVTSRDVFLFCVYTRK